MRLAQARVQNYRSIRDTDWFDVEEAKTILVGPNEAGKTAVLEALQRINAPAGVKPFDPLRDYPRKLYNEDIQSGRLRPEEIPVASARFKLGPGDVEGLPAGYENATYCCTRYLGNDIEHWIDDGPEPVVFTEELRKDCQRLAAYASQQTAEGREDGTPSPSDTLQAVIEEWQVDDTTIEGDRASALRDWLDSITDAIDDTDANQDERHTRLLKQTRIAEQHEAVLEALWEHVPLFVYYGDYFRVRPNLHLRKFAERVEQNLLDDDRYDYGNKCLLKLLGFSPRELADLGAAADPHDDPEAFEKYREPLDERGIKLNAASSRLTGEIRSVWNPDGDRPEAETVRVVADGQYLKVVVVDELGVEIEFDQRSGGFQWLVSFFVVFFAEAADANTNAILLLDEPGLSLHGLKQREFRKTISRLAEGNQTLYTTHSPFLVGPDELHLVRVVEMTDRNRGTEINSKVIASDPAALLPLQEALGYDLAQSLFMEERNLVLEGLTDYWYVDATAQLLRAADIADLNDKIALIPASSAGKVVYFATILHANNLKVAALLDSDNAGDSAAKQDTLVHTLGNARILRTRDVFPNSVAKPEIEDILRTTLVAVAESEFGHDVASVAKSQPSRPVVDIFSAEIPEFSKYQLAKAYLRWTQNHTAEDLTDDERSAWRDLIDRINRVLN